MDIHIDFQVSFQLIRTVGPHSYVGFYILFCRVGGIQQLFGKIDAGVSGFVLIISILSIDGGGGDQGKLLRRKKAGAAGWICIALECLSHITGAIVVGSDLRWHEIILICHSTSGVIVFDLIIGVEISFTQEILCNQDQSFAYWIYACDTPLLFI